MLTDSTSRTPTGLSHSPPSTLLTRPNISLGRSNSLSRSLIQTGPTQLCPALFFLRRCGWDTPSVAISPGAVLLLTGGFFFQSFIIEFSRTPVGQDEPERVFFDPIFSDCTGLDLPMLQRIQELRSDCLFHCTIRRVSYFYSVPYPIPTRHIVKEIRHGSSRRNSGFPAH